MAMDWDKLRIFHAVALAGSFTHAGEALNLSQSAISRQISTLEDSIGVPLFHRHARGLILTEQGELLYNAAKDIFTRLAMIEGQLGDSKELSEGPLTITVAEFFGTTWLAPIIKEFHDAHPEIDLTILLEDRVLNLGMREADAAIRLYEPLQQDLVQRHLTSIKLNICASRAYLEEHGSPETGEDLKSHTLIAYPEDAVVTPYDNANWHLDCAGFNTRRPKDSAYKDIDIVWINSLSAVYEAAKTGLGIAALPDYLVRAAPDLVPILTDIEAPSVDVYFVFPEERRHSGRIVSFRNFLLKHISMINS
tara:strand:+ start:71310 stop:72230 length:921 start_codon:yes stop_codon:yes gene_type:complete